MSAFECFCEYMALKNHFTKPSYDYFKYNGKTNVKPETFDKRKDKLFFQKLAKHKDVHNFLLSNFIVNEKAWIRELAYSDTAEENYKNFIKRNQSISYLFKNDLGNLDSNFNNNFIVAENEHPILLKQYLAGEISIETLCILLKITGAKKYWDKNLEYDIVWEEVKKKVEKYTPFIKADLEKMKQIVLDYFDE